MSHGTSGSDKCEPNLVPLLDLVLQMIMFFMLCGNFASEDLNKALKLPTAVQAKPLDKNEDFVVFLNIDKEREPNGTIIPNDKWRVVLPRGADPLTNRPQVVNHLKDHKVLDDKRIAAAKEKGKDNEKLSLVVIRADEKCSFKNVNEVLEACRQVGYRDVQLRATVARGKK
jgi:biopolymer transport protein ExbD